MTMTAVRVREAAAAAHELAPPIAVSEDGLRSASLARRMAAARRDERASLLREAVASGEPIVLPGADLRGIALGAAPLDLSGAELSGALLSGADLRSANLRGARLDGALLVRARLQGADLSTARLQGAQLSGARLDRADLSFADLRGASLLTAELDRALLSGADLREALLHTARLPRAVLRGADLRWSHLDGACLVSADLRGARFCGASLAVANLSDALVSDATDFGFAFLHRTRLDRVALSRKHLSGGVGERYAHPLQARDTYVALRRHFESEGRQRDARWAQVEACRMETLSHRPDRAHALYAEGRAASPLARGLRTLGHASLWGLGHLNRATTNYGTSYARIASTLALLWLAFALLFSGSGTLLHAEGDAVGWRDGLRYSAAALTPMDAYPLVVTAEWARAAELAQGVLGMLLLGALGFVTASRIGKR